MDHWGKFSAGIGVLVCSLIIFGAAAHDSLGLFGQTVAAWVQALGAIGAILVAQFIANATARQARKELLENRRIETEREARRERQQIERQIAILYSIDTQIAYIIVILKSIFEFGPDPHIGDMIHRKLLTDMPKFALNNVLDTSINSFTSRKAVRSLIICRQRCIYLFETLAQDSKRQTPDKMLETIKLLASYMFHCRVRLKEAMIDIGGTEGDLFDGEFRPIEDYTTLYPFEQI